MATEGIKGFVVETRNYGATAAFWRSLGFENVFETDHGSGQWQHPSGGPYVFIAERQGGDELQAVPVLTVPDVLAFAPDRPAEFARPFEPQHWGVMEAVVLDPDGRGIALQGPLPEGVDLPHDDH